MLGMAVAPIPTNVFRPCVVVALASRVIDDVTLGIHVGSRDVAFGDGWGGKDEGEKCSDDEFHGFNNPGTAVPLGPKLSN